MNEKFTEMDTEFKELLEKEKTDRKKQMKKYDKELKAELVILEEKIIKDVTASYKSEIIQGS